MIKDLRECNKPPLSFYPLAKPTGALCNLNCRYCYYLSKSLLYPESRLRMTDELLETYIRQMIETQQVPEVNFAWQGGEPTLMGLDFFRRSIIYQQKFKKPGMIIHNMMQTNGILFDDKWCEFFRHHNFLIGLSLDGPQKFHDTYRVDKNGRPTFKRVMHGLNMLRKHSVDFNVLTTVHAANADDPLEVYRFLRDEVCAQFIQFIPIVEIKKGNKTKKGDIATNRSVRAKQYGEFLRTIFDEWVRRDVGRIFVQIFDVTLEKWVGASPTLCVFAPTCGTAPVIEHNGDVYACDHFVEPKYLLGNINRTPMRDLVASDKLRKFGWDKRDMLPHYCKDCSVNFACNGGCPKNRFIQTPDGELGLNYLCAGYKDFFHHIDRPMRFMANMLNRSDAPAKIMPLLKAEDFQATLATTKRNDQCPCNSGKKFKHCHGSK
jgi:uncharacterized protein